jgi:hypothetical protein
LRRKIADDRFNNLIWKALRAGYLWKDETRETLLGSPQGSICSPILANVYLHELDEFIDGLRRTHEKGDRRKPNPAYKCLFRRRQHILESNGKVWTKEVKELTKQMRCLPSVKLEDPEYVRIKYLRYADDWIVGVTGPKALAESVRDDIRVFLNNVLRLQLSTEKTFIRHARTEEALFLGTRLRIGHSRTQEAKVGTGKTIHGRVYRRRITGWQPVLEAPISTLIDKLHQKGFCRPDGFPTSKSDWTPFDTDQLVSLFSSANRGLLNYYRFAHNFRRMVRVQYILRFSLAKTLAHKYRTTMRKVFQKHGRDLRFKWELPNGGTREVFFWINTDWTVNTDAFSTVPKTSSLLDWHMYLRTRSKLGFPCLVCGSTRKVQMHHVRHIRKMGDAKPTGFQAVMRALNRKQVPVCEECHQKIHRGEYDGIRLSDLAYDFVARRT